MTQPGHSLRLLLYLSRAVLFLFAVGVVFLIAFTVVCDLTHERVDGLTQEV